MLNNIQKVQFFTPAIFILLIIQILQTGCKNETKTYLSTDDLVTEVKSTIIELPIDEFIKSYEGTEKEFLLIDVRQEKEYNESNISGSVCVPRGILEFKIANETFWEEQFMYAPTDTTEVIIYCKKGSRGALAVKTLMELGYKNVKNLEGGFLAYDLKKPKEEE